MGKDRVTFSICSKYKHGSTVLIAAHILMTMVGLPISFIAGKYFERTSADDYPFPTSLRDATQENVKAAYTENALLTQENSIYLSPTVHINNFPSSICCFYLMETL